jgi:beta-lactamase regulating signal transducer with metallopeptidase domain
MFFLRGVAVSFSIGVISYACLSLAIALGWRVARPNGLRYSPRSCADLLFALRLAPALISVAVMLVLAVPSFLWLEPRAVTEPIGVVPVLFCAGGLAGMLWGIWNAASALRTALKAIASWSKAASIISWEQAGSNHFVPIVRSGSALAPLTAAGIVKPTVWLSDAAESTLSERELRSALQHEMVHVRRRDNLRKLILCALPFPGMTKLESAWLEASEMAADDAAVSNSSEALDLAAAVINLSRLAPLNPPTQLTTALVHSPIESLNARVERLICWNETRQNQATVCRPKYILCTAAALAIAFAGSYIHLLILVHAATELLVR